jgi:hypothetical protein
VSLPLEEPGWREPEASTVGDSRAAALRRDVTSSRDPRAEKRLRILHVVQGYAPAIGGTERVVQRLSEEILRQYGDEVTVFTTDAFSAEAFPRPSLPRMAPGWETRNGVHIRRFPCGAPRARY